MKISLQIMAAWPVVLLSISLVIAGAFPALDEARFNPFTMRFTIMPGLVVVGPLIGVEQ